MHNDNVGLCTSNNEKFTCSATTCPIQIFCNNVSAIINWIRTRLLMITVIDYGSVNRYESVVVEIDYGAALDRRTLGGILPKRSTGPCGPDYSVLCCYVKLTH